MSTNIDVLKGLIDMTAYLFVLDLKALPDGKFESSPMGVARTPQDIATEVAGFNRLCCNMLMDQPNEDGERAMFESVEAASAGVEESAKALSATVTSMAPEALQAKVTAPWGQEMTKYDMAQMAALNTMYHDGQLNYFQALHGDGEMHWH
jgi:hypothetical protein